MSLALLKIRLYGDPCLRKKSIPVESIGPSERVLIESMIATMHEAKGVGLAAPHVGINQRLFVADAGDGPMVFINPKITRKAGAEVLEEGCLSIPVVTISIKRPQAIIVSYMDEQGRMKEIACEGLLARIIQHETDHLNGKLIVDYATDAEKDQIKAQLKALKDGQKV